MLLCAVVPYGLRTAAKNQIVLCRTYNFRNQFFSMFYLRIGTILKVFSAPLPVLHFPSVLFWFLIFVCLGGFLLGISKSFIICAEERSNSHAQPTLLSHQEGWKAVWHKIEDLYTTAVHCGDLWKEANKSLGKRRALSELLKLLESSGLSRHKSAYAMVRNFAFGVSFQPDQGLYLLQFVFLLTNHIYRMNMELGGFFSPRGMCSICC